MASFSGSGSGSNFPNGLVISDNGANSEILSIAGNIVWGRPVLTVSGSNQYLGTGDIVAGTFYAAEQSSPSGNSYFTGNYGANSIEYQGNLGSGSNTVFLSLNDTALGTATPPFILSGVSTINGSPYGGGGGGSNFPAGISFGTSNGLMTLTSPYTTGATAVLQGTVGNDAQLVVGNTTNYTLIAKDDMAFYDTAQGGVVDFAQYGGGGKILVSNIQSINALAPVLDSGSNTKVTSSGSATTDGSGVADIALPFGYRDSNSYSVLVTQTTAQPVICPWVRITDSNAFQIVGDASQTICWMCIGIQ